MDAGPDPGYRDVSGILGPGVYRLLWDPMNRQAVQAYDLTVAEFVHQQVDTLLKEYAEPRARWFQVVDLREQQVGLVYKNGRLEAVLPPSSRTVYWRGPVEARVDVVDIAESPSIEPPLAVGLSRPRAGTPLFDKLGEAVVGVEVADSQVGQGHRAA
jgi:hypothetical protein